MQRCCDVAVRPASEADDAAIAELRGASPGKLDSRGPSGRIDDSLQVLVADVDGTVAGMVAMGSRSVGPAFGVTALEVTEVHVRAGFEHCGVGAVLVAAATSEAERLGCDHLLVTMPSSGRQMGLVSRLGLANDGRRLAPVATLRRRLGLEVTLGGSVLARRRAVLRAVDPVRQPVVRRG